MSIRTTRTAQFVADVETDFGLVDNFGRKIGAWYIVERSVYVDATPEQLAARPHGGFYTRAAGTYFDLSFGGLRNGECYQSEKRAGPFATLEEAEAAGRKRFGEMRKRLARKFPVAA